jgi:hypothetical protein
MFYFPAKTGRLFSKERARAFATIAGGRAKRERSGLETQTSLQAGIQPHIHGFHNQAQRQGGISQRLGEPGAAIAQ